MIDWRPHIVEMVLIKQADAEADTHGLWEHRLPAVAATEEKFQRPSRRSGSLDEKYRDFLRFANGWPAVFRTSRSTSGPWRTTTAGRYSG